MPGIPMSRSPRMSARSVSQTGFLMRWPMILLLRQYSNLWRTIRNRSAAMANDLAVEKIFQLMENDQEQERGDGQLRRFRKSDADDDGIADQVSDNREQAREKRNSNYHRA